MSEEAETFQKIYDLGTTAMQAGVATGQDLERIIRIGILAQSRVDRALSMIQDSSPHADLPRARRLLESVIQ